jgi:lysophospholipase L1-like esterase
VTIGRRRRIVYALTAIVLSIAVCLAGLLAADVWAHRKFERAAGLNMWGYRGTPAGRKGPHEIRVAVLGGSTVLGYGLAPEDSFPSQLQRLLNRTASPPATYSVVNLGYNNEGTYAFRFTLADYAYLDPDIVVFYEGYNDLGNLNSRVSRHESIVFRLTGYSPILPIVIEEKARQLRFGDVRGHRADDPVVFRPGVVNRTAAQALEASKAISDALERQMHGVANGTGPVKNAPAFGCSMRWGYYCSNMVAAIDDARRRGQTVIVATQPYGNYEHREQQEELRRLLASRYGGDARVRYADFGNTVSLLDPAMCWDGMHLTIEGNARIAAALAPVVRSAASATP